MTKAQEMTNISNKATNTKTEKRTKINQKYADKIIDKKIRKSAKKGFFSKVIKLNSKYNFTLVTNKIIEQGFDVYELDKTKNGKRVIQVCWSIN